MFTVELKGKQTSYLPSAITNNCTTNNNITTNLDTPTSAKQDCITVAPPNVKNNTTTINTTLLSVDPITTITPQPPSSRKNLKRDLRKLGRLNKRSSVMSNKKKNLGFKIVKHNKIAHVQIRQ